MKVEGWSNLGLSHHSLMRERKFEPSELVLVGILSLNIWSKFRGFHKAKQWLSIYIFSAYICGLVIQSIKLSTLKGNHVNIKDSTFPSGKGKGWHQSLETEVTESCLFTSWWMQSWLCCRFVPYWIKDTLEHLYSKYKLRGQGFSSVLFTNLFSVPTTLSGTWKWLNK